MATLTTAQIGALPLRQRIRWARREAGFSQVALARALGITQNHVSRWETGRQAPSRRYQQRLAALTGQPEGLFSDDDEVPG